MSSREKVKGGGSLANVLRDTRHGRPYGCVATRPRLLRPPVKPTYLCLRASLHPLVHVRPLVSLKTVVDTLLMQSGMSVTLCVAEAGSPDDMRVVELMACPPHRSSLKPLIPTSADELKLVDISITRSDH